MNKKSNSLIKPEVGSNYAGCGDSKPNAPIPQGQIKLLRFFFSVHAQAPRNVERAQCLDGTV
jgi:hypothetical protein